jgi:hypothetical protein
VTYEFLGEIRGKLRGYIESGSFQPLRLAKVSNGTTLSWEPTQHLKEPTQHLKEPTQHLKEPKQHLKEPTQHLRKQFI